MVYVMQNSGQKKKSHSKGETAESESRIVNMDIYNRRWVMGRR